MTTIKKELKNDARETVGELIVNLSFSSRAQKVVIKLNGIIIGQQSVVLRDFLQNASCFPGTVWEMDLSELRVLSSRSLKMLYKLAGLLKDRGYPLTIRRDNQAIRHLFQNKRARAAFSFPKEQSQLLTHLTSGTVLEHA